MTKINKEYGFRFLFDNKILINLYNNYIDILYLIDDGNYFLRFNSETKKFEKMRGFGRNIKIIGPYWWKDPRYEWKEI